MKGKGKKNCYYFYTSSNAAPFFSETRTGFVESKDPMKALERVVRGYKHPAGLFATSIFEGERKDDPLLAQYLSGKAILQERINKRLPYKSIISGNVKEDGFYVDGKKVMTMPKEKYKLIKK